MFASPAHYYHDTETQIISNPVFLEYDYTM